MVPVSGYEMLACADWLRTRHPVFGRCSRKLVRHLCKLWWRAGWCGRDILHAMDHRPSVFAQPTQVLLSPTRVMAPAQFIRSRLSAWRTPEGAVHAGYWAAKVAAADDAHTARSRVAVRYGRAGAGLLRAGERALTAERIAEHGRTARAQARSRAAAAAEPAVTRTRSTRAGVADLRRAQLVAEARAELARHSAQLMGEQAGASRAPDTDVPTTPPSPANRPSTPPVAAEGTVYERARARAHAERGRGARRRRPPHTR